MNYKEAIEALEDSIAILKPYVYGEKTPDFELLYSLEEDDPFHNNIFYEQGLGCDVCPLGDKEWDTCCIELFDCISSIPIGMPAVHDAGFRRAANLYLSKLYDAQRELIVRIWHR